MRSRGFGYKARAGFAQGGAGVFALALGLLLATPARALPTTQECLMCHRDRGLARSVGRGGSLFVEPEAFTNSAHAGLSCAGCHRDAVTARHAPRLARVTCAGCHAAEGDSLELAVHRRVGGSAEEACRRCHGVHDVVRARSGDRTRCASCHKSEVAEYEGSIHGLALASGDSDASTCRDCHGGTHSIRARSDPRSMTSPARLAGTCGRCHGDRALMAKRKITIPEAVVLYQKSVHGRSRRADVARCNDCHESHRLRRATDPQSSVYRRNIPATCGRCHAAEARAYAISVHGTASARGVTASPVCTDCHGEHRITGPRDLDSPVSAANVTATCSRCHEAAGIRETFGLPAGRLESYRDSYHGLAARGGSRVVANCQSCHGYHDILPSSDPRSSVSAGRLAETCGHCHPGTGVNVRLGSVHVAMATATQPVLYWTRIAYLALIGLTIGFMLLHNGLDFARKIGRSFQVAAGRIAPHVQVARVWYERMTLAERIQHALLGLSFFILVYTGFALRFPEAWGFTWFARLEGGHLWRGLIHRIAAVVMVAVSLFHVVYLATPRGRRLLADLFPRARDGLQLVANTLYLMGLRRTPPAFARFGYIEKAEYWALIWGTLVMTVTGFVLWFENAALRSLPKWMLDLATLIHYYEAWLAFLAIVVWHLYQNILNPDVYPMNWTWLTGKISGEQLRHEHRLEWELQSAAIEAEPAEAAIRDTPDTPRAPDADPR